MLHGDTAVSHNGLDTYGSRSLPVGGVALCYAADKVIDKARQIVAHQQEVSADDLEFANGTFTVKGSPDKGTPLAPSRARLSRRTTSLTGWSRARGDRGLRPAELLVAAGTHVGGRRGRHRDG